jgi:hypothetical protein
MEAGGTPSWTTAPETWHAEFRTVVYDWDGAATVADANGRPDVAAALRTGRVGRG